MKICIDGFGLDYMKGTGCYTYLYGLISSLIEVFPQAEYDIILQPKGTAALWGRYKNVSYPKLEVNRKDNDLSELEQFLKNSNADLFLSPCNGFSLPSNKICKYMMAVHDLAPLKENSCADDRYSEKFLRVFPEALMKADSVIAVSENIKQEILRYYPIPEHKVEIIKPCCMEIFKPMDKITASSVLKEKYNLDNGFILYAGSIHPRKNLEILIRAFHEISNELTQTRLVLIGEYGGKRKEYYQLLKKLIDDLQLQEKVVFTGRVDLYHMPYFYNCAGCFVNLSDYEGYPLTAVEASACGTPVVCLRNTAFIEADIKRPYYLKKPESEELRDVLFRILNNVSINGNNMILSQQSFQLSGTDWNHEARKLVHIIEKIIYEI